jgi:hypothetical protein
MSATMIERFDETKVKPQAGRPMAEFTRTVLDLEKGYCIRTNKQYRAANACTLANARYGGARKFKVRTMNDGTWAIVRIA